MEAKKRVGDPPFLRNVGLLLTYHCQASCAHCILKAGPSRREEVKLEDARNWIEQIAAYRDHYVIVLSLTGGEPFSNMSLLRRAMELAVDNKLSVSVITNGFWAVSRETAKRVLQSLPEICFISISTDLYHQQYISFERVKNALWAFEECGIPYYVSLVTEHETDPEYQRVYKDVEEIAGPERIRRGITFPVGRAREIETQLAYRVSQEPPKEACIAASSPCIFPDGRVYGCIGPLIGLEHEHPLLLGNALEEPLCEIFDRAETNVLLHALRLWGPSKLISMVKEAGLGSRLPFQYASDSVCNTCYSLLSEPVVHGWLKHLEQDSDFRTKVAFGRLHYLKEPAMLELGGCINQPGSSELSQV